MPDPYSAESLNAGNTYGAALKQRLAELLRMSPGAGQAQGQPMQQIPQMGGMAGQGQQTLQNLPYQRHVQEAQAMGQQPMTPEQFMQSMQQGMQGQ